MRFTGALAFGSKCLVPAFRHASSQNHTSAPLSHHRPPVPPGPPGICPQIQAAMFRHAFDAFGLAKEYALSGSNSRVSRARACPQQGLKSAPSLKLHRTQVDVLGALLRAMSRKRRQAAWVMPSLSAGARFKGKPQESQRLTAQRRSIHCLVLLLMPSNRIATWRWTCSARTLRKTGVAHVVCHVGRCCMSELS